jgi:hypothetical protein
MRAHFFDQILESICNLNSRKHGLMDFEFSKAPDPQFSKALVNPQLARKPLWMRCYLYSGGRGGQYCRFMWGRGHQIFGQMHVNGGAASTNLVQERKAQIEAAINSGAELLEILELIRPWQAARPGRKPF